MSRKGSWYKTVANDEKGGTSHIHIVAQDRAFVCFTLRYDWNVLACNEKMIF
jgi:hypothetical protein